MSEQPTIVFTDGAAKGNPGPGGWGAVVVTPEGHVIELGGGAPHTTNNRMELSAAIGALEHLTGRVTPIAIYTDSTYIIRGIREWIWAWRRRGWKTASGEGVPNRDLWERLSGLVSTCGTGGIEWHWVRGHVGTSGNERCDEIAVAFSSQRSANLYNGPLVGYGRPVLDLPDDTALPKPAPGGASAKQTKAAAHAYVSVVDGIPMRHATWAECEHRVKGRSGARFKKATSEADVAAILRGWGLAPDAV